MAAVMRRPSVLENNPEKLGITPSGEVIQDAQQRGKLTIDTNIVIHHGKTSLIYQGTIGNQSIAVKLLCCDELARQHRFSEPENEMMTRIGLRHPGIVKTLVDPYLAKFWYVYPMELGGQNLGDYLISLPEPKIPEAQGKQLFRQIAYALAYMHSQEMAHMKVSLFTIVFGNDGNRVFLVGLGQCQRKEKRVLLENRPKSGFKCYWSPDMLPMVPKCTDGKYDPYKADTWALGYTMFQALTGQSLWGMGDDEQVIIDKGHHLISRKLERFKKDPKAPSGQAMKLIFDMMYYFEGTRLTMAEVLAHRWFKS